MESVSYSKVKGTRKVVRMSNVVINSLPPLTQTQYLRRIRGEEKVGQILVENKKLRKSDEVREHKKIC